jgi:hypothetical protein
MLATRADIEMLLNGGALPGLKTPIDIFAY